MQITTTIMQGFPVVGLATYLNIKLKECVFNLVFNVYIYLP